jgi:rhomboid family GlyGly-CTERM serine protease
MNKLPIPMITLFLFAISGCLMLLPDSVQSVFYFDRQAVAAGSYYQLVSGHFIHGDINHWLWNSLALLVLGAIIEVKSKRLLLVTLLIGIASVDALLLSPLSSINYYCGLSGILNTLLVTVFWIAWREYQLKWIIVSALLCAGKIALEMSLNNSLLTHIQWPPYPAAHLAGALAGGLLIVLFRLLKTSTIFIPLIPAFFPSYLRRQVSSDFDLNKR